MSDSTLENMTLCSSRFNRDVKKAKLPSELSNHDDIMARLDLWKDKIEDYCKNDLFNYGCASEFIAKWICNWYKNREILKESC